MAIQEFDFATGKVLDPKRRQVVIAVSDNADSEALKSKIEGLRYQLLGQSNDIRPALELVRKHKVGVLILDAELPGVDIRKLLPSIKEAFSGFHIVVLTGNATREMLGQVLRLGAAGLLVKPVNGDAVEKIFAKFR